MTSFRIILAVLALCVFGACGGGSDNSGDAADDDTTPLDDDMDDDTSDDDALDDDVADDDTWPPLPDDDTSDDDFDDDADDDSDDDFDPPTPNPDARADAFRLFYKERSARVNLSLNRFALSGDAVAANAFSGAAIAKSGDDWEVVAGPSDNNPFGKTLYSTWKLYQAVGGRDLELALIRMFEGVVFNEAVSGHPGLTTREAFPAWTRTMDGIGDAISRTRDGAPVSGPVTYDGDLEQEILDTFYDGVSFVYRENPEEWMFNHKPINALTSYATTYVFDELDHDPPFLRQSDCCSSFMITQTGPWTGAIWGNHNSRDNFTDYAMGFIAAFEVESLDGVTPDLAAAAHRAAEAARRVGDNVVAHDNVLVTVDEWHDYDTLTPAGAMNPDGEVEWQDLGSLASCQMAYVAHAISTDGLSWPVPTTPLPGAIETSLLRQLFDLLGISPPLPLHQCNGIDDAFVGLTWGDLVDAEIFGIPLWDAADLIATLAPDLFPELLGGMMDDFSELMLGAVNLCAYARAVGDDELYDHARQTLGNFVEIEKILARLVYGVVAKSSAGPDDERVRELITATNDLLYNGALYARMFGIDSPLEYFEGFSRGNAALGGVEGLLNLADTAAWALLTDDEIAAQIEARLVAITDRAPWRVQRYRDRFGYTYPVRRAGDGYECIGPDDNWMPTENARHVAFGLAPTSVWFEATLCVDNPITLDCAWARLGCAPPDLDDSGGVDATDSVLFTQAWTDFGEGASCSAGNAWCDGADLDQGGTLDADDQGYMDAAQGCVI
ncbi:MAG: hypothetical protein IT350_11410 [Deltaproteobacteria bacterium]|nr:hypothetical protein [Deltaproteobacteria bacterium]